MKVYLLSIISLLLYQFAFSQVVINEINYRNTVLQQETEFIELYNNSNANVDLSNWILENGISYKFEANTFLAANQYLIVAKNVNDFSNNFNLSTNVYGPFEGKLSNLEDNIVLRNANFEIVDKVNYQSWNEWNNVRFLDTDLSKTAISLQKINPNLEGKFPGSWKAASPNPLSENNAVFENDYSELPIVNRVSKTPNKPNSNETVKIEVEIEQLELLSANNAVNVFMEYQIVNPGNYIAKSDADFNNWINVLMLDDGTNGDANANNGVYTFQFLPATINHRTLVRYRIMIESSFGFSQILPDQNHKESNYSFYVYDEFANVNGLDVNALNSIQSIQLLTNSNDVEDYIFNYNENDYPGEGTLIYNGEVYDHINFRSRGKDSRHKRAKRNLKFALNREKPVYTIKDNGKVYDEPKTKISLSGTYINDANSHGLTESIIYKIFELTGAVAKNADYCQLRIVDDVNETGSAGDFWGLYLILDNYDKSFWQKEICQMQIFMLTNLFELAHEGETGPIGLNNSVYNNWNSNMGNSQNNSSNYGAATASEYFYNNNLNFENHYGFIAANEIIANAETNYAGQHQYKEYYNPEIQKWSILSGDYDQTFGMPLLDTVVYQRSQSNPLVYVQGPIKNQLFTYAAFSEAYKNEIRSTLDLLLNTEQINYLVDNEASTVYNNNANYNWTDADQFLYNQNYNSFETDVKDWYKNFFATRASHLYSTWADNNKPNMPSISYAGSSNFALDDLVFLSTNFQDSQGQNTFKAMQWRIAEWSDPNNLIYENKKPIYEIEPLFTSNEILVFNNQYVFDGSSLKANHTYKVRVRHKDNTDKWSKWSQAINFVAQAAINPFVPELVITEINYNPSENCGAEFVEIFNKSNQDISLDDVKFTNGVEYKFPENRILAANQYLVLAEDSFEFMLNYGFSPFGEYSKNLSNNGEKIVLKGAYDIVIDSLEFSDTLPWNMDADGFGSSLSLIDFNFDNSLPESWFASSDSCGTPGFENNVCVPMQNSFSSINPTCYNASDGIVFSDLSGGISPFSYNWSNGTDEGLIINVAADTFYLEITDAFACVLKDTVILENPLQIVDNETIITESFFDTNDAAINLNPTNGTAPFSFLWNTSEVSDSIFNLSAGNYSVEITDFNNCSATFNYEILPFTCNGLSLNLAIENESLLAASNGSATLNLQGGIAPFNILWSNNLAITSTISNLAPGNYFVEVSDATNCTTTENFVIEEFICDTILINANVINETCYSYQNGIIEINLLGGNTPFTFDWSSNGNPISGNTNLINNLDVGNYEVVITDSTNCIVSDAYQIDGSNSLLTLNSIVTKATGFNTFDGLIINEVFGGTSPYTFNWSNGDTLQNLQNLNFGTYNLEIVDSFGCTINDAFNIDASPNSCGFSFTNQVNSNTNTGFEILISAANNANNYELHYRNTDSTIWNVAVFSDTILSLTDLQICSTYEYKVRSVCNVGIYSDFTFPEIATTACDVNCIPDLNITVDLITENSASINWNEEYQFTYNLYFKSDCSSEFILINNVSNPFTLFLLEACNTYNYYLESICAVDSIIDYATINSFDSDCPLDVLNIEAQNQIVVYPNPAQNIINIKSDYIIKSLKVYNQKGALIKIISKNQLQNIDISDLNAGVFYLEMETENGSRTYQSFLKK